MSERIKDRIREHTFQITNYISLPVETAENCLLEWFITELAEAERRGEAKTLNDLRHEVAELKEERLKIMKTAAELKVTSDALKAAVDGAIGLIGNPTASTPDSTVTAFQSDVQAQVDRLNAAEAPPPPPPPTP